MKLRDSLDSGKSRSRSNIDAADVHAAEELRKLQQNLWRTETRSRCNSLSSSGSASSRQDLINLASPSQSSPEPGTTEIGHAHTMAEPASPPGAAGPVANPAPSSPPTAVQLSIAERAALACPFPRRQRRQGSGKKKLNREPRVTAAAVSVAAAAAAAAAVKSINEPLPPYHRPPMSAASSENSFGEPELHALDGDECSEPAPIPLRDEETSFEGVSMAHLRQLELLQLQHQMLLLAEARLKTGFGLPPNNEILPSYDVATDASVCNLDSLRSVPDALRRDVHNDNEKSDAANAEDLSILLQASV